MAQGTHKTEFASRGGKPLALVEMRVTGTLHHAFAVVEMTQTYRNAEAVNIEATYSFPLPFEATLLHLAVRLNDKSLLGRVAERQQAEREYEEAVDAGNTAVMLEEVERGLYTMNVGNLMAGELAEVTMRFALPLKWEGRQLRLALPTTVAPRYGYAAEAGVQPHQEPAPDLMTEHRCSLALRVMGELARAELASPSHAIAVKAVEHGIELGFQGGTAPADRDFVLTLTSPDEPAPTLLVVPDGHAHVAHVALRIPERGGHQPVVAKILVDCSGSMAGDSIALAKQGALHALGCMRPGDWYSVSAFGSTVRHGSGVGPGLIAGGSAAPLRAAREHVQQLDANLGGTEMLAALQAVFVLDKTDGGAALTGGDVLLITDGETWDRVPIVQACRASGHRVFVIGIGASPDEAAVREIAQATGGAAAFVSPNEDIRPVVEGHLRRMRVPRIIEAQLEMPGQLLWTSPRRLAGSVFPGDTLHVFCGVQSKAEGAATLRLRYADGGTETLTPGGELSGPDAIADADWPRIAAAARIRETLFEQGEEHDAELVDLAVHYQVISPFTNYIFVHLRGEDAATDSPQLRQVPNMLAAGWGGTGSVRAGGPMCLETGVMYSMAPSLDFDMDFSQSVEVPAFLRKDVVFSRSRDRDPSPSELIAALNPTFTLLSPEKRLARTLDEPNGLVGIAVPVSSDVIDGLRALMACGWREEEVLIALWMAMLSLPVGALFSRAHRRGILRAARQAQVAAELVQWLEQAMAAVTEDRWSWQPTAALPQRMASHA
jgi:Ca-activated chloride channel family protein